MAKVSGTGVSVTWRYVGMTLVGLVIALAIGFGKQAVTAEIAQNDEISALKTGQTENKTDIRNIGLRLTEIRNDVRQGFDKMQEDIDYLVRQSKE